MTTLTTIRAAVRQDLHDEDSNNYRWTDAVLNRHIAQAVRELSFHIPREIKTNVATTAGSRAISVSGLTDLIEVAAVEFPVDDFPPAYVRFSLWGATVTLLGDDVPDGSNAYVYWYQPHSLDAGSSTLPAWTEDLVALGAAALAAIEWANYAINRVNLGGDETARQYLRWGAEALRSFRSEIARRGRKGSVRSATLYAPPAPRQSQSTDPGP